MEKESKIPLHVATRLPQELVNYIDTFIVIPHFVAQINSVKSYHDIIRFRSNTDTWLNSPFFKYALMKSYTKNRSYDSYIFRKWMIISNALRLRYL